MSSPVPSFKTFSDFSVQQAVDRALANLPPGHTVAAVAHVDGEGASLSFAYKVADEWTVEAAVVKNYNQPFSYGAEVIWSR